MKSKRLADRTLERAFSAGYRACKEGQSAHAQNLIEDSRLKLAWGEGWQKAFSEERAKQ